MRRLLARPEALIALVAFWLMLTCDSAYWLVIAGVDPANSLYQLAYYVAAGMVTFGLTSLLLLILAVGPVTRVMLGLLTVLSSAVAYFSSRYGVLFDEHMLTNVIETSTAEASELWSTKLLVELFLYGLVPAILIARYPFVKRSLGQAIAGRAFAIIAAVAIVAGGMFLQGAELISLARNHREIRYLATPLNILSAAYAYGSDNFATSPEFRHLAQDAARIAPASQRNRPLVQVLIVGETARAANFSLGEYARQTNPRLETRPIIYFSQASSCGTATATSLPCMFSLQTRTDFDRTSSRYEDNLLDIAERAGYRVIWLDNGNSCKFVCARVESRDLHLADVPDLCESRDCYDEILVHELQNILADVREDTLIVMHQIGSHGPAYYLRHPREFSKFVPECTHQDLGECSQQEIINAYDNTILYTDHVVDQTIDVLEAHTPQFDTALLYVSDHGESLGEYHLYLHGIPYKLAPAEQTHVPMLAWFSQGFQEREGLGNKCAGKLSDAPVSHDYLFHTTLALLQIRTAVYEPKLDLFAACHAQALIAREHNKYSPYTSAVAAQGSAM